MMGFGMMGGMVLFWVLLIVLSVILVRGLFEDFHSPHQETKTESPSAMKILEERYARGEINQEQYHLMRQDLEMGEG